MNHDHKIDNTQLQRMEKAAASIALALVEQNKVMEAMNRTMIKIVESLKEGKNGTS